jgi:thiamine-phosphate diphosphorylase
MSDLPRLALITDRTQAARPLGDVVAAAVASGCRMVILRDKDLPPTERASLAADLIGRVGDAGGLLLSAGDLVPGCDGVHLPRPSTGAPPSPPGGSVPGGSVLGQSCHDLSELRRAERAGADYATVSPVFASASKPGYGPLLGAGGLAELAAATALPVFALGGVETPDRVRACIDAGAHGVAVMGLVMRADDPGAAVEAVLDALGEGAR